MNRNTRTLIALIHELDRNLSCCDSVVAGAHWQLVEDIAARRARAVATLRAVLRWYGECVPTRRARPDRARATVGDLVAADRDLARAYEHARTVADDDAPEARLLAEQFQTMLEDRAELIRQVSPFPASREHRHPRALHA
ncbi:hypothetical protein [Pseudooceanicola sp.]|uniref:hypothetical protein n=1 Tax=Pseudooceanicola sp. TaxID=1914328 RepID=UPI00351110F2